MLILIEVLFDSLSRKPPSSARCTRFISFFLWQMLNEVKITEIPSNSIDADILKTNWTLANRLLFHLPFPIAAITFEKNSVNVHFLVPFAYFRDFPIFIKEKKEEISAVVCDGGKMFVFPCFLFNIISNPFSGAIYYVKIGMPSAIPYHPLSKFMCIFSLLPHQAFFWSRKNLSYYKLYWISTKDITLIK